MIEQFSQLIVIVASIFSGIAWLISFLQKRFDIVDKKITNLEAKLDDKVTQALCQERRSSLPCCGPDGVFRCPVPKKDQTDQLIDVLNKLAKQLNKED